MKGAQRKPPGDADLTPVPHGGDNAAEEGRRHVRGSTLLLVGRLASLVLTVATQVLIVRYLTKSDFGAFAYALALTAAGRTLLSLGQGRLLSRFMSTYEEQRDYNRMFGSMFLAVATIAVTSTVTLTALIAFSDVLIGSAVDGPAAVRVVLIVAFLAPLEALDQVFVSLFAVFSKPRTIFFRKYLLTPGLRLLVVVVLALSGASLTFLATGYVLAQLVGIMVYVALLVRVLRERGLLGELRWRKMVIPYRAVFGFSVPLITNELVFLSMNVGGVILLAHFQSIEDVANYRAVFPAARLNQVVFSTFVTLFLPLAARLFVREDIDGLRAAYWRTALFLAVLTFPVFALTGPFAPATTEVLFGVRYTESSLILSLLAVGYYFNVMLGFNTYTLQVCGRLRYLVVVNVVVATGNFVASLLLVPHFSAVGVAAANCATMIVQNLLNQAALRRSIRSPLVHRDYLRSYGVIVLCGAALWVFQYLVAPGLLLALGAAAVASAVVFLVNRRALALHETFPELLRVPVLRRLVR